jgi:hypothetical protein
LQIHRLEIDAELSAGAPAAGPGKLRQKGLSILLVEQDASLAVRLVDYVQKRTGLSIPRGRRSMGERRDQIEVSRHLTLRQSCPLKLRHDAFN